jgi:hypothetical protein
MAQHKANYNGLRKRETYDELIDYLKGKQEVIKYPDRFAKRVREHPFLTQLDGEGLDDMAEQQENAWKEQEKEHRVKEFSHASTQSAPEIRTQQHKLSGATASTQYFDLNRQDSEMTEEMDTTAEDVRKRQADTQDNEVKKQAMMQERLRSELSHVSETYPFVHFAAAQQGKKGQASSAAEGGASKKSKQESPATGVRKQVPPSLPRPPPPPSKNREPPQPEAPKAKKSKPADDDKPKVKPVKKSDIFTKKRRDHGTEFDASNDIDHWEKQTKAKIIDQITKRGYRGNMKALARKSKKELAAFIVTLQAS